MQGAARSARIARLSWQQIREKGWGPAKMAQAEVVTVEGRDISFCRLGGTGPDCLLLHGFGSDRLSWRGNQTDIASVASVASLDLPGHGESGLDVGPGTIGFLAGLIAAILDRKRMRGVHLVGHSLGGGLAIALAGARPDLVASLVLIAPAGLGAATDAAFLAAFPRQSDPAEMETLLHRLVSRPRLINKHMVARVLGHLAKPGARAALTTIAGRLSTVADELAPDVAAIVAAGLPRLVVWGDADAINILDAPKLAAFGGRRLIVPGAGHMPHVEATRAVNAAIVGFLGGDGAT